MKGKKVLYEQEKVIHNGTTTIVYGCAEMMPETSFSNAAVKVYGSIRDLLTEGVEKRGIAKLDPHDTYDEKIGVRIASNKAEVACAKNLLKRLNDCKKLATDYLVELNNVIDELEERKDFLNMRIEKQ